MRQHQYDSINKCATKDYIEQVMTKFSFVQNEMRFYLSENELGIRTKGLATKTNIR